MTSLGSMLPRCTLVEIQVSHSTGCAATLGYCPAKLPPSRWQHLQHHNLLHALRMLSTSMEALLRRVLSPPSDFDTGPDTGSRDAARSVTPKPTSGCSDLPSFKHTEISEALNWAYTYSSFVHIKRQLVNCAKLFANLKKDAGGR